MILPNQKENECGSSPSLHVTNLSVTDKNTGVIVEGMMVDALKDQ